MLDLIRKLYGGTGEWVDADSLPKGENIGTIRKYACPKHPKLKGLQPVEHTSNEVRGKKGVDRNDTSGRSLSLTIE